MSISHKHVAGLGVALLLLSALAATAAPTPTNLTAPGLAPLIVQFDEDQTGLERTYNLPWSERQFDRLEQLYTNWQTRVEQLPFKDLDLQSQVDHILLRKKFDRLHASTERDRQRLAAMNDLLPFRDAIQKLEQARWQMQPLNASAAAAAITDIPDQIKKLRARLEKGKKGDKAKDKDRKSDDAEDTSKKSETNQPPLKISASQALRAAGAAGEIRETLKRWHAYYDGALPDFDWWLKRPYDDTAKALEEYEKFLREEIAGIKGKDEDPLIGEPVGAEWLQKELNAEMIPYTPRELLAIAEKEMAWCDAHFKEEAKAMGEPNWKAALAKVKADHAPPGTQDEMVNQAAREAIQFVKDKHLIAVPPLCEETWRLTMLPSDKQKFMPYVAYSGGNMLVAYAREDMKYEDKLMSMRSNNKHFIHITTPHELIPGHHLQIFTAARQHPERRNFSTPFLVEGWALYWELRLWDEGFGQTPQDRIAMLFWRAHRCARIITTLKFHLGEMTPQQMVDYLVDRVGHEKLAATSEVRRYVGDGYSPLYQCAYMLGGLQLKALHEEMRRSQPMTEEAFHDAVLSCGPIPVELIRALVLGQTPAADGKPVWKFAGPAQ